MAKFKAVTHWLAGGVIVGASWVVANPEKVQHAVAVYPKLSIITSAAALVLAIYHASVKPQ